jgi:hypothetical protein
MIRFPSGTGTIPTWRGVTDAFDPPALSPAAAQDRDQHAAEPDGFLGRVRGADLASGGASRPG